MRRLSMTIPDFIVSFGLKKKIFDLEQCFFTFIQADKLELGNIC